MDMLIAIVTASLIWFVVAGILFFNPIVDKIYRSQDGEAGVRVLPPAPKTIGMILVAILIQIVCWSFIYYFIQPILPGGNLQKGLIFGGMLVFMKMLPRDIDRILLSTYPKKRMVIEFIIGSISCLIVGVVFGYLI